VDGSTRNQGSQGGGLHVREATVNIVWNFLIIITVAMGDRDGGQVAAGEESPATEPAALPRLAPLSVSLPQFFLFMALFFQIFAHWGATHFQTESGANVVDWFLFTGAHAVRAVDFLDLIHSYNLDIQTIHHGSLLVSVLVQRELEVCLRGVSL
jgi:hypothetical protein